MTPRRWAAWSGLTAAVIVSWLAPPLSAQGFEGKIRMRTVVLSLADTPDDPASLFARPLQEVIAASRREGRDVAIDSVTLLLKGSRLRAEGQAEAAGGYAVFDYETGRFRMVSPAERTYVEWTVEELRQAIQTDTAVQPEVPVTPPAPEVRALGAARTINGMACRAYEVRTRDAITHAWVTDAYPDVVATFTQYLEHARAFKLLDQEVEPDPEALVVEHGFPVLVQTLETIEAVYEVSETVAIERQALADSLFEAPTGYRRLTLQDLMRPDR